MTKSLIIIPACGFGTRMGLLPHEAKELISDPYNNNKPLIDWHLDNTKDHDVIVVTREEKSDLIDHLYKDPETNVFVSLMSDVSKEWPATVLHSKLHWENKNILLLPDTRFEPTNVVSKIDEELNDNDFVFAVHKIPVSEKSKWGWIDLSTDWWIDPDNHDLGTYTKVYGTQEKPILSEKELKSVEILKNYNFITHAWGIIGFRNTVGEKLFQAYLDKSYFDLTPYKTCVIFLDKFADITRTGKIEQY